MLLINLLPWRKNRMRQQARRWLGLLWLQLVLMLCLVVVLYFLWQHRQQRAQEMLNAAEAEQRQLTSHYQQTYSVRDRLRRYQEKERTEAIILRDNRRNLQLFEQLVSMLPARLWLTEIVDRRSHLLLSGLSENYDDIIALQHALSRHASVERVHLLHTSRERDAGTRLSFSFRADWFGMTLSPQEKNHD
ncbi:PilN domain-containing protein [Samsonia erythrinae]|uniref:Pilus assembly protein HofN n=1 Tax=Samsonia erythrinae TaxID=160434 RepID=A0A4R3VHY6_9GAMM|nr:PilN domain-containing protein [Samsonia erythrinae]TCV05174.1 pilus assembly protein HofN [Samsonia erythrinae]